MKKTIKKILTNSVVWLFLIIVLGFVVRLYKINTPLADWHSWRQADTASVTRIFIEYGVHPLVPKYYDISTIPTNIVSLKTNFEFLITSTMSYLLSIK